MCFFKTPHKETNEADQSRMPDEKNNLKTPENCSNVYDLCIDQNGQVLLTPTLGVINNNS